MIQFNSRDTKSDQTTEHAVHAVASVYTREAFRAILSRQPEWKIRAALEEGNIPSSNIQHAIEWLEEREKHHRYLM